MATTHYDLIAVGTGAAASTAAFQCRKADWKVAIIDSLPFGGTCQLRGCDPKKVLVGAGALIDAMRRMGGKGIRSNGNHIDWAELMRFKRTFTDPAPRRSEEAFRKAGIATFHGTARFAGSNAIHVGADPLESKHFLIATGAKPQRLNIPGEENLTTSDQFLELDSFPRRIVFIGGGYISFEFAHLSIRAGSQVTVLHRGERPLGAFDRDLAQRLMQRTRELGIQVELRAEATAVQRKADRLIVVALTSQGPREFEAEMVVHGSGRVADLDELNLAAVGVEATRRGVTVNSFLQSTSNPAVYAAGDAADTALPKLTPVAGYEGRLVASNLLNGNHRKVEKLPIPSVVFTVPPLAAVGMTEATARKEGRLFEYTLKTLVPGTRPEELLRIAPVSKSSSRTTLIRSWAPTS